MKNLLNLNGAQELSKTEQQSIKGGFASCVTNIAGQCVTGCNDDDDCNQGHFCTGQGGYCQPGHDR